MLGRTIAAAAVAAILTTDAGADKRNLRSSIETETLLVGGGREIAHFAASPRPCAELCLEEERCGFWTYSADGYACRLYEGPPSVRHIGGQFKSFTSGEVRNR